MHYFIIYYIIKIIYKKRMVPCCNDLQFYHHNEHVTIFIHFNYTSPLSTSYCIILIVHVHHYVYAYIIIIVLLFIVHNALQLGWAVYRVGEPSEIVRYIYMFILDSSHSLYCCVSVYIVFHCLLYIIG